MTPSDPPRVSVCIPTYNGAAYLPECLDSVLGQTFSDFEVLVADSGSTDDTRAIAEAYAARDARIRVVPSESRIAMVANWNRCVGLVRSRWIKFVFQDDLIAPFCLARMLETAQRTSSLFVVCRRTILQCLDQPPPVVAVTLDTLFGEQTTVSPDAFCEAVLDHPTQNFVGEPTAVLLHRDVFRRFGLYNPALLQLCDLEYWHRVGVNIGLGYVPETLATFRVHPGSTTAHNLSARSYRVEFLDPAILHHEAAYHPAFAPLRQAAARRRPRVSLTLPFLVDAVVARARAREGSSAPTTAVPSPRSEWEFAVARYPRLHFSLLSRARVSLHWRLADVRRRLRRQAAPSIA